MKFVDALKQFFAFSGSDLFATYCLCLCFSIALTIFTFSKNKSKHPVLLALLNIGIFFVAYAIFEPFVFASFTTISTYLVGIFLPFSFIIIPILYIVFFTKDQAIHKMIKASVLSAAMLVTCEIEHHLGLIAFGTPNIPSFILFATRTLPSTLLFPVAIILRKNNLSRFGNLPSLHVAVISILSTLLVISSTWQSSLPDVENVIRWLFVFSSTIQLILLVTIYLSIYRFIDSRHRLTELEVQSSILSVEKESLIIDIQNREELMKIRHDLKNQLSYISVLLNDGKYEEANKYILSLTNQKEEYLYSFSCPNLIISGIVNLELTKAKLAKKKISFKAVVPPQLPFEDSDLLSLITNIVDNAIENFVPKDDKDCINVSIVAQSDYLRITSLNSINEDKAKAAQTLRTTKRGKAHGYGTKIIKNIASKYNGYASFKVEDGKFVCDALINVILEGNKNA